MKGGIMRRTLAILTLLLAMIALDASADERGPLGVGAVFGEPTGISAKQYLSGDIALDLTVYWSFVANDTLYVHLDYLHHTDSVFDLQAEGLTFYAGLGGMIQLSADPAFGARIPFGISYFFSDIPLETFFEIGPMLYLYPEIAPSGTAGLGLRYYF
jgi:hypothetical protein